MSACTIEPVDLRCEYKVNPLGIDVDIPRLSWKLRADGRGRKQGAYQVLVASSPELLAEDKADLWDSGKVESDHTVNVVFDGLLQERSLSYMSSMKKRWWKVRAWDADDRVSDWSDTAWWEFGLFLRTEWHPEGDWKTRWIGLRTDPIVDGLDPALYLRRDFALPKPVKRARLFATALGVYAPYINGTRAGDEVLAPGYTDYHKHVQYQTYDVGHLLREGDNAIGMVLAGGWFSGWSPFNGFHTFGERPRSVVQLHVEYEDGEEAIVASDEEWTATTGPVLASDIYMGETYDARREMPGWSEPGFDAGDWSPVDIQRWGTVPVKAQAAPPIRRMGELKAVSVNTLPDGAVIVDLGQNFAGRVRLTVRGTAGDTVTLRHGEWLNPDGTLWTGNLGSAKATDTYILKGGEEEIYEPTFTYHGFRYVEVTGYPGEPSLDAVTGIVLHADIPQTGAFECSNPLINKVHEATLWGQRSNFLSVPTDCPQRSERAGWTGDGMVFAGTACFLMDSASFLSKWMLDIEKAQSDKGSFPDFAPRAATAWDGDGAPGWAEAGIVIPWTLYQRYGDTRIIRKHYAAMTKFMDYIREPNGNYLRQERCNHNMADWLNMDAYTGWDTLATALWAYDAMLMSRMARAIGREHDAVAYEELYGNIKTAFNEAYVTEDGRVLGENIGHPPGDKFERREETDNQTGYVLALAFDLLDGDARRMAADNLVERIKARDWHLSTGFIGTGFLLPALEKIGRLDVAYRLLETDTLPSWIYMVKSGATTMWERWDGWTEERGPEASLNHFAFGCVCDWLYRSVAGIDVDLDRPAFRHIVMRPRPGGSLDWAGAEYESVQGKIASRWERKDGTFRWNITIPPNTTATVHVPTSDPESVTESGTPAADAEGVEFVRTAVGRHRVAQTAPGAVLQDPENTVIYTIGSGDYFFEAKEKRLVEASPSI